MKKLTYIFLLSLMISGTYSCQDQSSEIDFNPNVLTAKDYIRAEDALFEIVNTFLKGIHDTLVHNTGYAYIDYCDVVYNQMENTMKFGYGDVNRWCDDNKFRRGAFYAVFTGAVFDEGVKAYITTDSLFVDDFLTEASIEIENLGFNSQNKVEYSMKVTSSSIMMPDTAKTLGFQMTTEFVLVWEEGSATPAIYEDDVLLVSGTAAGISTDGYSFSLTILEPLINQVECFWISGGFSQITVPAAKVPTGDIDYLTENGCFNQFYFYFDNNQFFDYIK
ncbi:MAG: hypothetical protein R6W71_03930 [Bacteroidales bacterium]